jgi:hypothetical protein
MGGMLAESSQTLPGLFGEKAVFGFQWVRDYPYALPSLINAATLSIVTLILFLFLEEVSYTRLSPVYDGTIWLMPHIDVKSAPA